MILLYSTTLFPLQWVSWIFISSSTSSLFVTFYIEIKCSNTPPQRNKIIPRFHPLLSFLVFVPHLQPFKRVKITNSLHHSSYEDSHRSRRSFGAIAIFSPFKITSLQSLLASFVFHFFFSNLFYLRSNLLLYYWFRLWDMKIKIFYLLSF